MDDPKLYDLAYQAGKLLKSQGWMLVTAESCTGGWVAKCITDIPGSSEWFERGFVTYGNLAKIEMLTVRRKTLEQYGAVSQQTVAEMTAGALAHSHARYALAVSGIAGPAGGTPDKPVGTVWLAWQQRGKDCHTHLAHFQGNRESIRRQAVALALQGILDGYGTD